MVGTRLISTENNLNPYFMKLVEGAVMKQHLDVTDTSRFYLVNLLSRFAKSDELFEIKEGHFEETPLAILLSKALNSDDFNRVNAFKKLGDVSLYISGYFSDHIDSKQVDIDYYISMGEGAYKSLSSIYMGEKTISELYEELSDKFIYLMNVLSEVRNSGAIASNSDLIRLYERWLKTGDPHIREKLVEEGIVPEKR